MGSVTQSLMRLFRGSSGHHDQPGKGSIPARATRRSSGLGEFSRLLAGREGLCILDIGPTSASNIQRLTELGHRVYSEDVLLERVFGQFEPEFLETLAQYLPPNIPCFWTGPSVVSKSITLAHVRRIAKKIKRPLLLWDNYPVNDLSMRDELHIRPLTGRDPRLPECAYGYMNNPLLQEQLSFLPLATCFDYANAPAKYRAESSWTKIVRQRFGAEALPHWRSLRNYAEASIAAKKDNRALQLTPAETRRLQAAFAYVERNRGRRWMKELAPWRAAMLKLISGL